METIGIFALLIAVGAAIGAIGAHIGLSSAHDDLNNKLNQINDNLDLGLKNLERIPDKIFNEGDAFEILAKHHEVFKKFDFEKFEFEYEFRKRYAEERYEQYKKLMDEDSEYSFYFNKMNETVEGIQRDIRNIIIAEIRATIEKQLSDEYIRDQFQTILKNTDTMAVSNALVVRAADQVLNTLKNPETKLIDISKEEY